MDCTFAMRAETAGRIAKAGLTAILFAAGVLSPAVMHAAGLNGTLSLSSTGTDTIAVNGTDIDFDYSGGVTSTFPPTATGTVDGTGDSGAFTITSASTSSFALPGLIGSNVTVHDLSATQQPTGSTTGPGLPLNGFITFTAEPGWSIALTEVLPGADGAAGCAQAYAPPLGVNCSPAGTPFDMTNEGDGQVSVSFAFAGTATDGAGDMSTVGGTFITTLSGPGLTYQQVLTDLADGEAIVSSANATIDVVTSTSLPEPASASLLLLGSGLLAFSAICRRRRQRQ